MRCIFALLYACLSSSLTLTFLRSRTDMPAITRTTAKGSNTTTSIIIIQRTASSSVSCVGSSPYISAAMYLTGPTSASNFLLSVSIVYFVSYSLSSNSSEFLIFNCNAVMSASVSTFSTTLRSVVIRLINSFDADT